jgi:hypothetical protein
MVSSSQYAGMIMLTSGVVDGCVNDMAPGSGSMLKLLFWAALTGSLVSRVCFVLLILLAITGKHVARLNKSIITGFDTYRKNYDWGL